MITGPFGRHSRQPKPPGTRRTRRWGRPAAVIAALALASGLLAAQAAQAASTAPVHRQRPAQAASPARGHSASAASPSAAPNAQSLALPGLHAASYHVSLITGDQVALTQLGMTGKYSVSATPVPRADGTTPLITGDATSGGPAKASLYVLPSDAQQLIAAGRVDKQLFNVRYLVSHGYTGAGARKLPVMVQYAGHLSAAELTSKAARLPSSTPAATQPGQNAVKVGVSLQHAAAFWAAVAGSAPASAAAAHRSGHGPVTLAAPQLAGGVTRIWLAGDPAPTPPAATPQASGPSYTVTATTTLQQGHGLGTCDGLVVTLCPVSFTLTGITGSVADSSFTPTAETCMNSNPCTTIQVSWDVPPGVYMEQGYGFAYRSDDQTYDYIIDNPQFTVAGATQLTFNLAQAKLVTVTTPKATQPASSTQQTYRVLPDGTGLASFSFGLYGPSNWEVMPTQPATIGSFHFSTAWTLIKPPVTMTVNTRLPTVLNPLYGISGDGTPGYPAWPGLGIVRFKGTQTLPLVDAGHGTAKDFAGIDARGKLVLMRPAKLTKTYYQCFVYDSQLRNAIKAGAAGVIIDAGDPDPDLLCQQPLQSQTYFNWTFGGSGIPPDIPWVSVSGPEARMLRGLLAHGTPKITVSDSGNSPYEYDLKFYSERAISGSLHYSVTGQQLEKVVTAYHSGEQAQPVNATLGVFSADESVVGGTGDFLDGPTSRTVYYGPVSPSLVWSPDVEYGATTVTMNDTRVSVFDQAGATSTADYGARPVAPGAPAIQAQALQVNPGFADAAICSGCRQGNTFYPYMYLISGAAGGGEGEVGIDPSAVHLYHDGQEIAPASGIFPSYQLPAHQARYRLTLDDSSVSDEVSHTTWRFTSAKPATGQLPTGVGCIGTALGTSTAPCAPAPLIFLRYDAGVSLANTVTAPGGHQLQVTAYHQDPDGPAITSLEVWTSTDGGKTWQQAHVSGGSGGSYTASYTVPRQPAAGGTVSLKVQAQDAAGNDVTQVIDNAYYLASHAAR